MPRLHTSGEYPADWHEVAKRVKETANLRCVRCGHHHNPAVGRTLTVHHFDGNKANCERWNLMALCQACHLSVQARVDPRTPIFFDPRPWAMPYIAGVYASGICAAPPGFDLRRWRAEYEREVGPWPEWAV